MTGSITVLAEDIVEVAVDGAKEAQALANHLRKTDVFTEVVPALGTVAVMFSPSRLSIADVESIISDAQKRPRISDPALATEINIPVVYGGEAGPDLDAVARSLALSPQDVIRTHTAQAFTVDMVGFTPGFAYLSGLSWSVPRLPTPRASVVAGSVGLAGGRAGVYSLKGPGGWPIIGRTSASLFDPANDPPFVLAPGSLVRFQSVDA
ncbi:MAG: 5-oxoprolinase subunit PxpB [Pseudomonadota bacterium]